MNYYLVIRKRAETHIREAYHWYESQRNGLGDDFLLCIDATLLIIKDNPFIFQLRYKSVRMAIVPKFPYGIFYFVDGTKIIITAAFHLSRHPRLWKAE